MEPEIETGWLVMVPLEAAVVAPGGATYGVSLEPGMLCLLPVYKTRDEAEAAYPGHYLVQVALVVRPQARVDRGAGGGENGGEVSPDA